MKLIPLLAMSMLLAAAIPTVAATNDITTLIQKGLFEEEANHNLDAAQRDYQAAVDGFDKDRKLAATAIFRLGEVARKQGDATRANQLYTRVVREFPDQPKLVKMATDYLGGAIPAVASAASPGPRLSQLQSACEDMKIKAALADRVAANVAAIKSHQELEAYFTTVRPDSTLAALLDDEAKQAKRFEEAEAAYGTNHQEYQAAERARGMAVSRRVERIGALISSVQNEAKLAHQQADDLQAMIDKEKVSSPPATSESQQASAGGTADEDAEIRKIQDMIQNSPDMINRQGPVTDLTPLGSAARDGHLVVARFLLDHGADVENGGPRSPLIRATENAHKAMVELLLSKGANVNAAPFGGAPALHAATSRGYKAVVAVLIAHNADVNAHDSQGVTPLHLACASASKEIAEMLITAKADVNATNSRGETPLYYAARRGEPEIVQLLLANHATVEAADSQGETPLWQALGNSNVFELLISNGANINPTNSNGATLLMMCAASRPGPQSMQHIRTLIEHHADVNAAQPSDGWHALNFAVSRGFPEPVNLLLSNGADPNTRVTYVSHDPDPSRLKYPGATPIIQAIVWLASPASENIVAALLDHGANPNLADDNGFTPLYHAIWLAQTNTIKRLIDHHADVNAVDKAGDPPLELVLSLANGGQPDPYLSNPSASLGPGNLNSASATVIRAMLLKAGANEDFQRLRGIFFSRKGSGSIGYPVFSKGTNSLNHHSLMEMIARLYDTGQGEIVNNFSPTDNTRTVPFPDFSQVVINRIKPDGTKSDITVDFDSILKTGDCSQDPALQWGDVVQIPEADHPVNQMYNGLPEETKQAITKCLTRNIVIIVKGQKTAITLVPDWNRRRFGYGGFGSGIPGGGIPQMRFRAVPLPPAVAPPAGENPGPTLDTFYLEQVVRGSGLLLISSDLTRVKVTRSNPDSPEHPLVMEYNLEEQRGSELILRDGDVIEIPERDANSPEAGR